MSAAAEGTPPASFFLSGLARSLAFTALLERTPWFGPMEQSRGTEEITLLIEDWKTVNEGGTPVTLWELAEGREPRTEDDDDS